METNDKRALIKDYLNGKGYEPPKYFWVYFIAVEDEEMRYLTKVKVEENMLFKEDTIELVCRPHGYEYFFEYRHRDELRQMRPTDAQNLPHAKRNISIYQELIDFRISIYDGTILSRVRSEEQNKIWQTISREYDESDTAKRARENARHECYLKANGMKYDDIRMKTDWQCYCSYRAKYGFSPEELTPG